jgi:uncharacterized protein YerC
MRVSENKLSRFLKKEIIISLAQVLTDINEIEKMESFLRDFFTDTELETFAKRLSVAYWLKKKRSYVNIKTNLKVSSATIAEVSQTMKKKGFLEGIKKMEAEEWANKWAEKINKFIQR